MCCERSRDARPSWSGVVLLVSEFAVAQVVPEVGKKGRSWEMDNHPVLVVGQKVNLLSGGGKVESCNQFVMRYTFCTVTSVNRSSSQNRDVNGKRQIVQSRRWNHGLNVRRGVVFDKLIYIYSPPLPLETKDTGEFKIQEEKTKIQFCKICWNSCYNSEALSLFKFVI